jgi:hypothetical protein
MTDTSSPFPSPEALALVTRLRERYLAPGNEHVLERDEAAAEIDRFVAERAQQEREACAQIIEKWDARSERFDTIPYEAETIRVLILQNIRARGDATRPAQPDATPVVEAARKYIADKATRPSPSLSSNRVLSR